MKPFEERYTEWIDGRLTGAELEAFERELPDRVAAEADRRQARGLGDLLRRHAEAPALANADFFSHQLLERLSAEDAAARPVQAEAAPREWSLFSLPNLLWGAACCLLLSSAIYFATASPHAPGLASLATKAGEPSLPITAVHLASQPAPGAAEPVYDASIIESTPVEPGVSATSVYSQAENVTVLWLDGLDYLPASYTLQ